MTLIVTIATPRHIVLVSDRRTVQNGKVREDEHNKATVLFCQDARAVVAFTGVAQFGKFKTSQVLLDALSRAGQPDHLFAPTMSRLVPILSEQVARANIPADQRHLTIVVAGYLAGSPGAKLWQITNSFDSSGQPRKMAFDKFTVFECKEPQKGVGAFGIYGFGQKSGVSPKDRATIRQLVVRDAPTLALVDKVVDTIRNASKSPKSRGFVGGQCNSIILPADPRQTARAEYHSNTAGRKVYSPNAVVSTASMSLTMTGGTLNNLTRTSRRWSSQKWVETRRVLAGAD